jgi:hypothetical protein
MRQILSRSLLTVAAASGILAATGGYASADTGAEGAAAGSPGVLSGNSVQAPIDVPANVCGNTVDAAALADPAFGNRCGNVSHSAHSGGPAAHTAHSGSASRDHEAGQGGKSVAEGSPGVLSGNAVDIPVHAPVNVCGNTVDAAALMNPAMGNSCGNEQTSTIGTPPPVPLRHGPAPEVPTTPLPPRVLHPEAPVPASVPAPRTHRHTDRRTDFRLAETGAGGREVGAVGATSAALLLGGAMLYRRGVRPAHARRTG